MTFLCGHARDQRSPWFCQEQTKLVLCYFYLLYRLWTVLRLEELKAEYYSWMRDHHVYKDIFEPVTGTTLNLQREPENAKDLHAVAIVEDTGRIVGHIPLALLRIVSSFLKKG